jgi:hypothetical protein
MMNSTVIVLGLVLVFLAHLKITLMQNAVNNVLATISDRFKVIDAKVGRIEALKVVPDQVEPERPQTAVTANSTRPFPMLLQTFYGLNAASKENVFRTCSSKIHGLAFEALWKACMNGGRNTQMASDLQQGMTQMNDEEFDVFKTAVFAESRRPFAETHRPTEKVARPLVKLAEGSSGPASDVLESSAAQAPGETSTTPNITTPEAANATTNESPESNTLPISKEDTITVVHDAEQSKKMKRNNRGKPSKSSGQAAIQPSN